LPTTNQTSSNIVIFKIMLFKHLNQIVLLP